ncbi:MAG: DNA-directed RNA polymerase subunit K [Candidatus Pacearchaeota archaeon]|nr:DNA-directed RNA polymerase subunit K [Candidatus Pacearchaeota archaeon]
MEKFDPEQYTKYEKARILGARALQISANAPILLKIEQEKLESLNFDPIKIAEIEFEAGVLPITVKRPLPKKVEKKTFEPREIIKVEKTERPEPKSAEVPEEQAKVEEEEREMEEEELTEEAIVEEIEGAETEELGEE